MSQRDHRGFAAKYPWRDLTVGSSFVVPPGLAKFQNLQTYAYRVGKKLGRNFKVFDHGPQGIEVAYVGDRLPKKGEVKKVEVKSVQSSSSEPINHWALPTAAEIAAREKKA